MQSGIGYCQILVIGYCQILVIGYCQILVIGNWCYNNYGYGLIMSNIGVAYWLLELKVIGGLD